MENADLFNCFGPTNILIMAGNRKFCFNGSAAITFDFMNGLVIVNGVWV